MSKFGEFLQEIRKARRLSQAALAESFGCTAGFISQLESGASKPPLDNIQRWAECLSLTEANSLKFRHFAHLAHSTEATVDTVSAMAHQLAALGVHAFDHLAIGDPMPMQLREESVEYRAEHPASVPLVGIAAAGKPTQAAIWQAMTAVEHVPVPEHWLLIKVTGSSAYPVAYPGQLMWVDQSRAVKPSTMTPANIVDLADNICLVQTMEPDGARAYIKRLCADPRAPGGFLFASIDAGRGSPFLPLDIIELILPVVGVWFEDPRLPRLKGRNRAEVTITV